MGVQFFLQGQGEGTLPDTIANGPGQGLESVTTGDTTVQTIGEIPANAKVPAHISLSVDAGSGVFFVSIGRNAGDVVTAANAQYRLDGTNGPLGVIIDNPRKGFILGLDAVGGAVLRAEGSWGI